MNLVGLCGSLRAESFNRKLMHQAAKIVDAEVFTDANLHLPLYDGDLEAAHGIPPEVQLLADQIAEADAVILTSPEYNHSLSGVMKNALDWISRVDGNPWLNKPVALMHATAGRTGGARCSYALRLCMAPFQAHIIAGPEVLVAGAHNEFDETGTLKSDHYTKTLSDLMTRLKAAA